MPDTKTSTPAGRSTRRVFLQRSAGAGLALAGGLASAVHAGGDDLLRIGLVGCGKRGTSAASQAMRADRNCKLVALGDVFRDRLESSGERLKKAGGEKFAVAEDRCFVGFDAYKQVVDCVDVVLLATPPHFRPAHLQYAVRAGKHVFAEKPIAVDAPGVRSVLAAVEEARKENLSIVSGLCWRYHPGLRETVRRVHDGAIGRIVSLGCNLDRSGAKDLVPRKAGISDMEWQIRNYPHFLWLSGDFIVDSFVYHLDVASWVMKGQYPKWALGSGGRQTHTLPEPSNLFDHHAVYYEFEEGVRCFAFCKQQNATVAEYSTRAFGADGTATLMTREQTIAGRVNHKSAAPAENMWQQAQNELFASIRAGKPVNDGEHTAHSTLMAVMGRMAAYTGKRITWEQALASTETLGPTHYDWDPVKNKPIAIPGQTPFA